MRGKISLEINKNYVIGHKSNIVDYCPITRWEETLYIWILVSRVLFLTLFVLKSLNYPSMVPDISTRTSNTDYRGLVTYAKLYKRKESWSYNF